MENQVVIVGAGIIGLATALHLQKFGYQVTVVDKNGIGAGASFGNAGHFATEQVFPLADPELLLKVPQMLCDPLGPFRIKFNYFYKAIPWFVRFMREMLPEKRIKNSTSIAVLNSQAIKEMQILLEYCNRPELIQQNGSFLVFESTPVKEVERKYQAYKSTGIPVTFLTSKDLHELEPSLSPDIQFALYFTDTAHTPDPKLICEALAAKVIENGGEIRQLDVTEINFQHEQVLLNGNASFKAKRVTLKAEKAVIAAGAWSKSLLEDLGYKVPLEAERGYHLMLNHHSQLKRPVTSYERKCIITPMTEGTRIAGMVEFGGMELEATKGISNRFLVHGKALLPELKSISSSDEQEEWMGFRPSLPDSLPVFGSTKHENVFVNFGHQHLGLTWSAITGKLVAQKMSDQKVDFDLTPYNINRF
ncbi:FAD-binding oxidoreductase [Parashewanella curva]|uniref:FAD-binding oxidoreductase n=1 Tax=Parashewanella curva TaxID=2338552 RepID=A0A3L8PR48_9GAMM|nr:FAD-dependent oxidoreductase [Parashewanella curva]RLV57857.1 FAD-binding oxidoreductase [Parashewanella curva]